jgi:RNA polymerase sigma-70 factor (ECF subfamily)
VYSGREHTEAPVALIVEAILQDQVWSEYRARLHRFILKRISDPAVAEDLVQEVLAKAYDNLERLKDREKLLPWLYQITRNAIIDHYRRRHPAKELDELLAVQEESGEAEAKKELACCLMPFIQRLPSEYQQAITMSEIEGTKLKQVALQLGLSLSGAKSRVQRGRMMLRAMFLECCRIERDRRGSVMDYQPKKNCDKC